MKESTMRLSLVFLCMSAGQSFVTRRLVAVSHPFSEMFRKTTRPAGWGASSLAFSHLGGAERERSSMKRTSLKMAETLAASENATTKGDISKGKTEILADDSEFVKPDPDNHEYRCIKLPNNLKVLLVSTSQASSEDEKSAKVEAASVHVQAGHFDDTIPGLAHFHEHMLFLGTAKYPGEDDYEGFLSKQGGFSNAYTDMEDTNYYFSVTTQQSNSEEASEGLSGGLDRLAQFFISPNFEEGMVERELRAIDSEYRNGISNDAWRQFQFLKSIANPKHPFSKFGCGNYETLTSKGSPVSELKSFWKKFYTTSNMRLAVVGRCSLDALQKSVEESFGALPYSNNSPRHRNENALSKIFKTEYSSYDPKYPAFSKGEQLGKLREVIPLMETRSLKVQFATPPIDDPMMKKTRPYRAISHLLGHESPGSLHHMLNELGYLTALSSGTSVDTSDFSLFSLTLSLTPKGMEAKEEVLDLIFQWIALIKKTALEQPELLAKYHDELRQIASTNFKFRENGDPTDFCSSAAELLFDNSPPQDILVSGSLMDEYEPEIAKAFLERLSPENCMIVVVDSGLQKTDSEEWKIEPLYGATYREKDISAENLEGWDSPSMVDPRLHVPALNEYIPKDFSLRCDDNGGELSEAERKQSQLDYPTLLTATDNFQMWHKMDRYWRVPKTFIRLSIVTPKTYESPRSMTLSRLYQRVLSDDLNSFVYDASLAGCHYQCQCVPSGFKVSIRGYSDKLSVLLDTLTTRMLSIIDEMKEGKEAHPGLHDKFEKAKESLKRETKNYRLDSPYEVANYNTRLLVEEDVFYLDSYVNEMEGPNAERFPLTMEECAEVAKECLTGRLKADALCIGNIDEDGAQEVTNVIQRHFLKPSRPLHDTETPKFNSLKLPTSSEAVSIFGDEVAGEIVPVKYQELAYSESEENNAVEMFLQVGCDVNLGYEGIGILDLITNMAYNSAYNQLRTKEQLGYIVSAYTRKTAGAAWGLNVVVQSSSAPPQILEERIESWLQTFRQELAEKTPESIALEARGIVAQLLEQNTKLSQEVGFAWNEIVATETCNERMRTPAFDRLDRIADELILTTDDTSSATINGNPRKSPEVLKERILEFVDRYFLPHSPERRAMSSRVFNQSLKAEYENSLSEPGVLSSYSDIRYLKEFLSTWPVAPYWRVEADKK